MLGPVALYICILAGSFPVRLTRGLHRFSRAFGSQQRESSFDPFGQAWINSALPVFQRRDPRLRRDTKGEDIKLPSEQLELGRGLIEKMSSPDFEPERYADEYRERALAMIEKKVKGNARRKQATLIPMMAVTENSVSTCGVSHHEPRRGTNNPRLPRKPTIKPFISLIPL
jgi:hypothetical protein